MFSEFVVKSKVSPSAGYIELSYPNLNRFGTFCVTLTRVPYAGLPVMFDWRKLVAQNDINRSYSLFDRAPLWLHLIVR